MSTANVNGLHCGECKIRFEIQQLNPIVSAGDEETVVQECNREFGPNNYHIDPPERNAFGRDKENGKYIGYRVGTLRHPITRPLRLARHCPFCGKELE